MGENIIFFVFLTALLHTVRALGAESVLANNQNTMRHMEYNEAVTKCVRGYVIVFTTMKILDYPYGIRLNHRGLKTTIHYVMIGLRTIIGLYFFLEILSKQIWIITNTFYIVFTNWWTFDFEQRRFICPQKYSKFNCVLFWSLWVMIISVIRSLIRNSMEIFSCESEQQSSFDDAPEPSDLKEFLNQLEINFSNIG